jgi:nucleoside-diphosphate kinase
MERTLAIIKPDAVAAGHTEAIIQHIKDHGFSIVKSMKTRLTRNEAEGFYAEHNGRGFFAELVDFMISGDVVVMVLEKEGAIKAWRDLMGATDPLLADEGTIRKLFGTSKGNNASHGSDSEASAAREVAYFFPNL